MKTPGLRAALLLVAIMLFSVNASAATFGNISPTDKYAWSETSGWINFAPLGAGVMIYPDHLEGYAWAENIGWIKLGSHSGGGAYTYANTTKDDWGVNMDASGNLTGFGWSETSGWIKFNSTNGQVTLNLATGTLDGYAWGENIGWIHFRNTGQNNSYGVAVVKFTITLDPATGGGISCPTPAIRGWDVTCNITPLDGFYISGLTDNSTPVSNPGASYTITAVNGDHTVSSTFSEYLVKLLLSGGNHSYFMTPQEAYGSPAGNGDVIECRAGTFTGPMTFNQPAAVWFEGGYNSGFGDNTGGVTTITGYLDIQTGAVVIENIEVK